MASRWRDPVSSQNRKRLRFWHSYPKSRIAVSAASPGKSKKPHALLACIGENRSVARAPTRARAVYSRPHAHVHMRTRPTLSPLPSVSKFRPNVKISGWGASTVTGVCPGILPPSLFFRLRVCKSPRASKAGRPRRGQGWGATLRR